MQSIEVKSLRGGPAGGEEEEEEEEEGPSRGERLIKFPHLAVYPIQAKSEKRKKQNCVAFLKFLLIKPG
jgi:hypothetical protein